MGELIPITTNDQGEPVVSARQLHALLMVKSRFNDWIKNRIRQYGFIENTDYATVLSFTKNLVREGRREVDYAITLDMAKELSMVERNEQGRAARQYFIQAEKALRRRSAEVTIQQEQRLRRVEHQLGQVMAVQQQAAHALLSIPRSTESVPEETTRTKIQRLVNTYCRAQHVGQQEVWRLVYDRLYYRYKVNIRAHRRSERESWLDVAERKGHLEKIYAIVSTELVVIA